MYTQQVQYITNLEKARRRIIEVHYISPGNTMWKKSCFLFNVWLMPVSKIIYLMLPSLLDNHPRIGEKIIWIVNLQSAIMSENQKYYTYWEWRTKLGNDRVDSNEQRRQPGQQDWLQPSSQISGATHRPEGLYNVVNILVLWGVLLIIIWYEVKATFIPVRCLRYGRIPFCFKSYYQEIEWL